jgi:hypothetical protein
MHLKEFSWKVKIPIVLIVLLGLGVCGQQAAAYFIPPTKGMQCQQIGDHTELPPPLIPDESSAGSTPQPKPTASLPATSSYERAGFGLALTADPVLWSARLGTSWYLDWDVQPISSKKVPTHWQMVRLKPGCIYPSKAYIRWAARRYPGNVWIIGNEPDVALQDNLTPEEYAQDYYGLYKLIKQADHSALIAVAGVSQATPLRLEYLDRALQYYQKNYGESLPVDWWTLHGYVLPEKKGSWGVGIPPGFSVDSGELNTIEDHGNIDLFLEQIVNFRTWMAKNGYRNTPLAITEFGILIPESFGYSQYWVSKYLIASVTRLDSIKNDQIGFPGDGNRLVQRWAWFSLSDPLYPNSDLAFLNNEGLTLIGQAYREYNTLAGH